MRTLIILVPVLMVLGTGCQTSPSKAQTLEPHDLALTHAGIELGILKVLDAGDTNRAYRMTLIQLKDSMGRMRRYYERGAFPEDERPVVQSISQVVLNYIEKQKERLGREAGSDHCGLEIAKVLSVTLTGLPDQARIAALREYFSSRFVKERELYE
jgi:hypothetical protein